MTTVETLRQTTEDDIAEALKGAYVALPITTTAELLEAFNRVLDMKLGESSGESE